MLNNNPWLKIFLTLAIIVAALMYMNPPSNVCRGQIEIFQESTKNLSSNWKNALSRCQEDPSIGGCIEFFDFMGSFNKKLKEVPKECAPELKDEPSVRGILPQATEMMVRAAWGSQAPKSISEKNGFLDLSHIAHFCRVKNNFLSIYGEESWNGLVNRLLNELPQAAQIGRTESWNRSILSDRCAFVD